MQACILIPVGIIAYTVTGGLKATFISSYIHTVIIYVVLCLFCFLVYSPSSVTQLGSPARVRAMVFLQGCMRWSSTSVLWMALLASAPCTCKQLPSRAAAGGLSGVSVLSLR